MKWIQISKKVGLVFLLTLSACATESPVSNTPLQSNNSLGDLSLPGDTKSSDTVANSPDFSQARVKNALRWQITPPGQSEPVSMLVGTVHAPIGESYQFPTDLSQAIKQANAFYTEADLNQAAQAAEAALPQAINPQQDLSTSLSAEELKELNLRLSKKGFPATILPFLRPWFVNLILGSAPEGATPENQEIMDVLLLKEAQQNQISLRYLEAAAEPLIQMQEVPEAEHLQILKKTLNQSDTQTALEFINIFTLYNAGDLNALEKLNTESRAESESFYQHLIVNRNQAWLSKLTPVLKTESVVVAVGSLHLLGAGRLIKQIKQLRFSAKDIKANNN